MASSAPASIPSLYTPAALPTTLAAASSKPPSAEEHADMSTTATLQMQDLDVGDGDNRTSLLMQPTATSRQPPKRIHLNTPPRNTTHSPHPQSGRSRIVSRRQANANKQPAAVVAAAGFEARQIPQDACDDESATKYCYRHRPDARTGRQAEDMSLEQVSRDSQKELNAMSQASRDGIYNVWSLFTDAPAKQRELMLRGILAQCCFPQLSFVSASVRELLKIDFLSALPPELGLRVLCFLDAKSLCQAAQVSHTWRSLADDDVIWHRMCEQHIDRKCTTCGWGLPLLDKKRLQSERSMMQQRLTQQPLPLPTTHTRSLMSHEEIHEYPDSASDEGEPDSGRKLGGLKRSAAAVMPEKLITIKKSCSPARNYDGVEPYFRPASSSALRPWKQVYRDRFVIGTNWKHGRCTTQVLKGHTSEVTCLQFDDDIIVTGSYDTTIKIWDVETGQELRTLNGHTMGVKCLQFDKSKLVSGSLDGTLKMWDLKNGKVIRTFPGHSGAVVSVHFDGSILASGSQDRTIRVRDFANCSRVSLRGHTDYVNSVRVDAASQTLFSASDDCTVRVWDLKAKRCLKVLRGHSLQVTQILPMPCGFEFPDGDAMEDDTPSSRSSGEGSGIAVPVAYPASVTEGPCPPRYVLSCSMDSTVRLWDVTTGRTVKTFFGHIEGIWAMAADTLRMVSGSNDGVVKLWDPRTARQERTFLDHTAPVTCVGLSDRRLITGSDKDVRVYNFGAQPGQ